VTSRTAAGTYVGDRISASGAALASQPRTKPGRLRACDKLDYVIAFVAVNHAAAAAGADRRRARTRETDGDGRTRSYIDYLSLSVSRCSPRDLLLRSRRVGAGRSDDWRWRINRRYLSIYLSMYHRYYTVFLVSMVTTGWFPARSHRPHAHSVDQLLLHDPV